MKFGQFMYDFKINILFKKFNEKYGLETSSRLF